MPETTIAPYESASRAERSDGKREAKPDANKTAMLRRVSAAMCCCFIESEKRVRNEKDC
jgi:hypothetical protein